MRNWAERRLGIVTEAKGGQELKTYCPFCCARTGREDTKGHLYISTIKPVAHCFRCEWSGHHLSLIISVEGCSYSEALVCMDKPSIDVGAFDDLYSPRGLVKGEDLAQWPDGFVPLQYPLTKYSSVECKAAMAYARKRFRGNDVLIESCCGYVPGTNRLWVVIDETWWQGRSLTGKEPKYISPPWPKADSLWNAKALDRYDHITICEGVFSAVAVGRNAVALCGKTANEQQLERIVGADPDYITIALDADALNYAYELGGQLKHYGYDGFIQVQEMEKGDPDDGVKGNLVPWTWGKIVKAKLATIPRNFVNA